jgi:hypothetical protein
MQLLFGNSILTTYFVWRKPWMAGGGCTPSSIWNRRQ